VLKALRARLHQGRRTIAYPDGAPSLPDRFRGLPRLDAARCGPGCTA
jgi:formate hydrogenlyase subunit 6/NADH:ubiquinone oxidoreductase subunit I